MTSRRALLNVTSRKKRDTMLTASNTSTTGGTSPANLGSLYVNGATGYFGVWGATLRGFVGPSGNAPSVVQEAERSATTCYMVGLSEKIRIQTSSGVPWLWRRICFRYRIAQSYFAVASPNDSAQQAYLPFIETSANGYERLYFNQLVNTQPNTINEQQSILFKGTQGVDWNDIITAPVDNRRVDLCSDVTRRISSGNASGILREYKTYYPMKKNLVYADDEVGETESSAIFSVRDKQGMGDYLVCDIFVAGTGATSSDLLQLTDTSTLYWHEK